jgi:hypothetical protein
MRWIGVVNYCLFGLILLVVAFFLFFAKNEETLASVPRLELKDLPKSPFSECDEFFSEIGASLFNLKWVPPQMQLPDLRHELLFCGKNARPDSLPGKASFYFALKTSGERSLVREGERTYLVYQGICVAREFPQNASIQTFTTNPLTLWGDASPKNEKIEKTPYVFSPGNQPTPLWFEVNTVHEQAVEVRVSMLDEKGSLVVSSSDLRTFQLQLQEQAKSQIQGWELGGQRVDASLLVRQKARWIGRDIFLEMHGGEEFAFSIGKERIDFGDGQGLYSCFIAAGDALIWKEGRWHVVGSDEPTQQLPLLVVKKVDEKIISFELWDPDGRGKILLSLLRSKDHNGMPNVSQEFKFVGAKTWAKFIVECRTGGRMTLKPHDWLVMTAEGWIKLDGPAQIDAYVEQSLSGPLFILEKMDKKNGRQVLIGHLFNAARTEVELVELTSSSPSPLANFYRHLPIAPPIQPMLSQNEDGEE